MKVAYVVPRYGTDIRGGAETGARMFAEHLVADRGYDVEVLTTCALDALTWRDELVAGTEVVNGVTVHRIASEAGRHESFHPLSAQLLKDPEHVTDEQAEQWVDWQGPKSPALLEALVESDADVIAFYPYLYYPTVRGLPLVRNRAIMHPAAHEEPALHLPVFSSLFEQCSGFVFQTRSERSLVNDRFHVATTRQVLVGLGVEESAGRPEQARASFGLAEHPYLVYVGRVDDKKGTGILWRYFRSYKERHPNGLKLVLVGQVVNPPADDPDIVVTGMIDDQTKWGLLRGAMALVAPSPYEAFSITVIEAMTAGAPVIVNAVCGPTREHCEQSGAGMWFDGFASFEATVHRMTTDAELHETMRRNGLRYVDANYRWPVILDRYCAFLERAAGDPAQANGVP
ncbi:MAG TPA: glycosyltransferase family 4 protein [Acidimicrobiales bacterium]|nr:glycosyltransferase family 4 protein [Acidimicrobiales bacterium]